MKSKELWCAAALALAAGAVSAADRSADAMTVTRDPVTGELRAATAEEMAGLARARASASTSARLGVATAAAAAQPLTRRHAGGATSARLTDEFQSRASASRRADGGLDHQCVEGHPDHAGRHAAAHPVAAAPAAAMTK